MENEIIGRQITVNGKVQGVWFRDNTRKKAEQLNIKGFVKNQPDGTVYIEAEGSRISLNEFIAWCQEGPPLAKVRSIDVNEKPLAYFDDFRIVR